MAIETSTLRIKAERLGTVTAVKELLTDLEAAYNSIYAFDFLVDSIHSSDNDGSIGVVCEKSLRMHHNYF